MKTCPICEKGRLVRKTVPYSVYDIEIGDPADNGWCLNQGRRRGRSCDPKINVPKYKQYYDIMGKGTPPITWINDVNYKTLYRRLVSTN